MAKSKKTKRVISEGVAHIHSSFNNTIITITDKQGNAVCWATSGGSGFRGSRKSTPFAAQIAAEKVGNNYKIVVEEKYTYSGTTDTMYSVYTLDSNAVLDWKNILYRTATELNEEEFNQDINGIEGISAGTTSANDTYADLVTTGTTDAHFIVSSNDWKLFYVSLSCAYFFIFSIFKWGNFNSFLFRDTLLLLANTCNNYSSKLG